jgi:hypothetical protein
VHRRRNLQGWIGVDLDGTLAEYNGWKGADHIGAPIPAMVERVKQWLRERREVRIFTARVWYPVGDVVRQADAVNATAAIMKWCIEHIGIILPVTCTKDYGMVECWDDRAVQVIPNTGQRADDAA